MMLFFLGFMAGALGMLWLLTDAVDGEEAEGGIKDMQVQAKRERLDDQLWEKRYAKEEGEKCPLCGCKETAVRQVVKAIRGRKGEWERAEVMVECCADCGEEI